MKIIGCDFHTRYQQIALLDQVTGELIERRLEHENGKAQAFYRRLVGPVRVGIEATGPIQWSQRLLAELGAGGTTLTSEKVFRVPHLWAAAQRCGFRVTSSKPEPGRHPFRIGRVGQARRGRLGGVPLEFPRNQLWRCYSPPVGFSREENTKPAPPTWAT